MTDVAKPGAAFCGVPLSVLDLAPIAEGSTAVEALANSTELAQEAERLGYLRHWVAEHHNLAGIASAAPAVLIAHLAALTSTIRVGSGGVMLPNHAPLVIAEQFGSLEALHPGRIDLGIGRAPGSDPKTARALRRHLEQSGAYLPELLIELFGFFTGNFPEGHPFATMTPQPSFGNLPEVWLLGSSGYSAQLAGYLGLPFSFAHHFASENTLPALELYRRNFRASSLLEKPRSMIVVLAICAETDEEASRLASTGDLAFVHRRTRREARFLSPEVAQRVPLSGPERAIVDERNRHQAIGSPASVARALKALLETTEVDEIMLSTTTYDQRDRLRSYELCAQLPQD